jgi:RNA polymerase sigma factor (sigma-70 family)
MPLHLVSTDPSDDAEASHLVSGGAAAARRLASLRVECWREVLSADAPLVEIFALLRGAGVVAVDDLDELARRMPTVDPDGRLADAIASGAVAGDREWRRRVVLALDEYRRERERFVRAHLALVVHFARRWSRHGVPFADLVQEGTIGLIHAADRYDPDRGVQFSTYAVWWLRQSIRRACREREPVVQVPRRMRRIAVRSEAEGRRLRTELGREPEESELARALEVTPERLRRSLAARNLRVLGLASPLAPGRATTALEVLADQQSGDDIARWLERHDVAEAIDELDRLDARERTILRERFGLDGAAPQTREHIAAELSLSGERVRQIQKRALEKLRIALDGTRRAG